MFLGNQDISLCNQPYVSPASHSTLSSLFGTTVPSYPVFNNFLLFFQPSSQEESDYIIYDTKKLRDVMDQKMPPPGFQAVIRLVALFP